MLCCAAVRSGCRTTSPTCCTSASAWRAQVRVARGASWPDQRPQAASGLQGPVEIAPALARPQTAAGQRAVLWTDSRDCSGNMALVWCTGGRVDFARCWRVIVDPGGGRPASGLAVSRCRRPALSHPWCIAWLCAAWLAAFSVWKWPVSRVLHRLWAGRLKAACSTDLPCPFLC